MDSRAMSGLAMTAMVLAGCAAGPAPVTTQAAEASCLSAVEAQTGTTGASVLRADRDEEKTAIFVTVPGAGAPYICNADVSGLVTDIRQAPALG